MAVRRKLTRREFLQRGCLAALGAGLAACAGPERPTDVAPVEPTDAAIPSSAAPSLPTDGQVRIVEGPPLEIAKDEPVPEGLHEARYYARLDDRRVQCEMCFRRCVVPEGGRGFAKSAKRAGTGTLFHTNGGMNEEPLAALLEHMDAVTVDLKAFTAKFYREVSSSELEPVLRTLQQIHRSGVHLEIVKTSGTGAVRMGMPSV